MFKSTKTLNATLFLVIALKPDLTIKMGGRKSLEKKGGEILMEVESTDNICNQIKHRLSQWRRRR
jgi:hypothetical protein